MKTIILILVLAVLVAIPQVGHSQYFQKVITDSEQETPTTEVASNVIFSTSTDVETFNEITNATFLLNCYNSFSYWMDHHKEHQSTLINDSLLLNIPVARSNINLARPVDLAPAIKLFSIR